MRGGWFMCVYVYKYVPQTQANTQHREGIYCTFMPFAPW